MLPKINCLKKKKDFERIFKKGKKFKEDFLVLRVAPNKLKRNRFGIVVSREVSKKATIRNKLKRRIKALLQDKIYKSRKEDEGLDVVLVVSPGLEAKSFGELEKIIYEIFKKTKLFSDIHEANHENH